MTKKFTLKQLFAIVDGRLSTTMDDIYDVLNHVTDTSLMTHHLSVASNYLKEKNPKWFQDVDKRIKEIERFCPVKSEVTGKVEHCHDQFLWMMYYFDNRQNDSFDVPQLKDETDTSDFGQYMINNSLFK